MSLIFMFSGNGDGRLGRWLVPGALGEEDCDDENGDNKGTN